MIIRPFTSRDKNRILEFYLAHPSSRLNDEETQRISERGVGVLALEGEEVLATGFLTCEESGRFEMLDLQVKETLRNQGLETQMLISLEILASKLKGDRFAVWTRSDANEDFTLEDINERMYYLARGYVFTGFRANRFGEGNHADRLEKELPNVFPLQARKRDAGFNMN